MDEPKTLQQCGLIEDPISGELVVADDADALADAWERVKKLEDQIRIYKGTLAGALMALTSGDAKTRRLRGERRRVRVEMPDDGWDQSILKEAWNSFPTLAPKYLRIATIGVQLREWNKMQSESGGPDFAEFRRLLTIANRGPVGSPRIAVEE